MNEEKKKEELTDSTVTTQTADEEAAEVAGQTANETVETTGNHKESPPGDGGDSKLDTLAERFGILEAEFESKIKYDRHREKIIDNLHKELQDYKNDLVKKLLRPVIMDIIHSIDNNNTLVNNLKEESQLDPQELLNQMAEISSELEEILFRQGVDPFDYKQPQFDPSRQKIVKTEITDDPSKDKSIAKKVHNGYEWEGNVLCRERVNVYLYKPGSEDTKTNKNEEKE
ncbi:MAG: nucleotide exchange factor GrpE [bacterium]|nr:nucleotide exchange factor GrpE [bacterium]